MVKSRRVNQKHIKAGDLTRESEKMADKQTNKYIWNQPKIF